MNAESNAEFLSHGANSPEEFRCVGSHRRGVDMAVPFNASPEIFQGKRIAAAREPLQDCCLKMFAFFLRERMKERMGCTTTVFCPIPSCIMTDRKSTRLNSSH